MDDQCESRALPHLSRLAVITTTNKCRLSLVATSTALLLGALACDTPTRPAINRKAMLSAPARSVAGPGSEWTTDIGTFTWTPQPSDTNFFAVLHGISPSGDSTIGTTCDQGCIYGGRPYGYWFGYRTEDLARVYRAFAFPTSARGINDSGDVVGWYIDSATVGQLFHGYLFHAGAYQRIEFPGSTETRAWGINNAGTIVGFYVMAGVIHQYTYANGMYTSFDLPDAYDACNTRARAINSTGVIVGAFQTRRPHSLCGGPWHGYIRDADGSTFTPFDVTGATSTDANGINDRGDIVGQYVTNDGKSHGYLLPGNGEPLITIDFPHQTEETNAFGVDSSGKVVVGSFGDFAKFIRPYRVRLCRGECGA